MTLNDVTKFIKMIKNIYFFPSERFMVSKAVLFGLFGMFPSVLYMYEFKKTGADAINISGLLV